MTLRTMLAALALFGAGCAADATPVDVRALANSGHSAFVCLGAPDDARPERPLSDCNRDTTEHAYEYGDRAASGAGGGGGTGDGGGGASGDGKGESSRPHLYALVTQTSRGEVALIDLTTETTALVDQNPATPGANFLPIGAQPTDIVTTPGSTAAFVGVAEVGRAGIFALPTARMLRPAPGAAVGACGEKGGGVGCAPPELSSWPSCSLDSAPGEMLLVADPADADGKERASCDAPYTDAPGDKDKPDLKLEQRGRQKLLVSMPDLGELYLLDAQQLLESRPGAFAPCVIERRLKLDVDFPIESSGPPPGPGSSDPEELLAACVDVKVSRPSLPVPLATRPAGLALAGDQLFVGDLAAPVIHVVSLQDVCAPSEKTPLLPTSLNEPERVVTTRRIAVTGPVSPALRRYLYAVDAGDGSVMVFDASEGAVQRTPLSRAHPEWNPFQTSDRIRPGVPVRDIAIFQRDIPIASDAGIAPEGVRCTASPRKECCDPTSSEEIKAQCGDEVKQCTSPFGYDYSYQTSPDFDSGAGPLKLRGTFAYLLLTSGQVEVVDIDDLDSACRGPIASSATAGCSGDAPRGGASGEVSCNAVLPHTPRAATYLYSSNATGRHEPGVQSLPVLFDRNGTILSPPEPVPRMRATLPAPKTADGALTLSVGGDAERILGDGDTGTSASAGLVSNSQGTELSDALVMNIEDPRVHLRDQTWAVLYEGALPGFTDSRAEFKVDKAEVLVEDRDARFCGRGVQSKGSVVAQFQDQLLVEAREELIAGPPANPNPTDAQVAARADQNALLLADYVQIASDLPTESAAYWDSNNNVCTFQQCNVVFGTADSPNTRRNAAILEAFEDRVSVEFFYIDDNNVVQREVGISKPDGSVETMSTASFAKCCFPGDLQYDVRAGRQWVAFGNVSGFLHHVVAAPETGVCRNSCDPRFARLNGRARHAKANAPIYDGSTFAFQNPMFRFAITGGVPQIDMQFRFITQGFFAPILISLGSSAEVQPQSIRFVPSTGELAITDGYLEGLMLLNSNGLSVARQFY